MSRQDKWLMTALSAMRPLFRRLGYPLPRRVQCVRGHCSQPGYWGEYFPYEIPLIVITRKLRRGYQALQVLIHEACHAACAFKLGRQTGHGDDFNDIAGKVGLTVPGGGYPVTPALAARLHRINERLGRYL